jgi:hypothetical protein
VPDKALLRTLGPSRLSRASASQAPNPAELLRSAAEETAFSGSIPRKVAAPTQRVLKAMLLSKLKKPLRVMLLAAFGLGAGLMTGPTQSRSNAAEKGDRGPTAKAAAGLGLADFEELKAILNVKNQPWTKVPWKYSLTEARELAAKSKKPIFMVVNTGNVLGCV